MGALGELQGAAKWISRGRSRHVPRSDLKETATRIASRILESHGPWPYRPKETGTRVAQKIWESHGPGPYRPKPK